MSSTAGFSDRISKQHRYAVSPWSCYRNTFLIRNNSIIAVRLCLSHDTHSISVINLSRQKQNMDSDTAAKNPVLTNARIILWHETLFCTNCLCVEIRNPSVQMPCRCVVGKPPSKWWCIFLLRETALLILLCGKLNVRIYLEATVLLLHTAPNG